MSSAAKRTAALQAQAAPPPVATSAARTPISVHLTPFAPGLQHEPINSRRRWATLWGRTPRQAVKATLKRCRLAPSAATAATEPDGSVSLLGAVPPELLGLLSGDAGEPVPFALFWDGGLTAAQVTAELEALRADGWALPEQMP